MNGHPVFTPPDLSAEFARKGDIIVLCFHAYMNLGREAEMAERGIRAGLVSHIKWGKLSSDWKEETIKKNPHLKIFPFSKDWWMCVCDSCYRKWGADGVEVALITTELMIDVQVAMPRGQG